MNRQPTLWAVVFLFLLYHIHIFLQHKAPSPYGEGAFIRACIILCYLLIVKLESEGQVSPNALVINLAVQFVFGVVVSYSTNDVFSEGVVVAATP